MPKRFANFLKSKSPEIATFYKKSVKSGKLYFEISLLFANFFAKIRLQGSYNYATLKIARLKYQSFRLYKSNDPIKGDWNDINKVDKLLISKLDKIVKL